MKLSVLVSALVGISAVAAIPSPLQPRNTCSAGKPKVTVKKVSISVKHHLFPD